MEMSCAVLWSLWAFSLQAKAESHFEACLFHRCVKNTIVALTLTWLPHVQPALHVQGTHIRFDDDDGHAVPSPGNTQVRLRGVPAPRNTHIRFD